ncbi:hypothetical protein HYP99_gp100 [Sinorhizobium phage ort11]|uniref:Uncharacterized protein n=1 Tax=Sinorhizobium phage ort11 TaxID=2599764 RepID=A0A5C2H6H9_9CAUD|nr:hypothetical protein HYP99_gp100 [Sinorhizobium phage ort11]QEP29893.1 hypothetical protein Smphiort11_095 [Sinorhizobium phage ort11]
MKLYFCWEQTYTGTWQPVVFHDELPDKSSQGHNPPRTPAHLVPEVCISNQEPVFGKLTRMFPCPEHS